VTLVAATLALWRCGSPEALAAGRDLLWAAWRVQLADMAPRASAMQLPAVVRGIVRADAKAAVREHNMVLSGERRCAKGGRVWGGG